MIVFEIVKQKNSEASVKFYNVDKYGCIKELIVINTLIIKLLNTNLVSFKF